MSACSWPGGAGAGRVGSAPAGSSPTAEPAVWSRAYWPPTPARSAADRSGRTAHAACCPACHGRPGLARSAPPFLRPNRDRVHDRPRPVDRAEVAQPVQDLLVHALLQPGRGPLAESAVRRWAADSEQRRRQLVPRTAGLHQVHDRRQHRAVVDPSPATALLTRWRNGDQRLRDLPQIVRCPSADHVLGHETQILLQIEDCPNETRPK